MTRPQLHLVHSEDDVAGDVQFHAITTRAALRVRQLGADRLEHSVIDESGQYWDETYWHPDTKALRNLRYRALAVFPDGHTVEGDSDEFLVTRMIYAPDNTLRIQALDRLLAHWFTDEDRRP